MLYKKHTVWGTKTFLLLISFINYFCVYVLVGNVAL